MKIYSLPALSDNYIYALVNEQNECAVIDPGEAAPVVEFLQAGQLSLKSILCTHHHLDHVGGVNDLLRLYPADVWTSHADRGRIPGATRSVAEADTLQCLGQEVRVLEVPGHTLGQIAFYFPRLSAVFVGDTLFSCGCGRMFEGTYPQFFASLQKFKTLPADTQIYFGHEYTLRNVAFVQSRTENSKELVDYKAECHSKLAAGGQTTPGLLSTELKLNPFCGRSRRKSSGSGGWRGISGRPWVFDRVLDELLT